MKNTLLAYIDRFRHDRRERAMLGSVLLVLAIIVTLVVYWQLRLSGVAMTNATYCGYEEHVHTEECYETTLVCNLEEIEGHTHDESCYDEEGNLVCELEETEGHTHSDECYEQTLICGFEEHTHTVECLVDLTADVEDATIWEATLPELTGDLRTDVVSIAYSQLGYTESVANYTLGEDGVTHLGYTRYGAWYGNAYSDWDSMFVAFCLEYADITEEFTFNAGAYAWSIDLANLGYYQLAESYSPTAGDILFLDVDSDGKADNTAVVIAVDESLQTVTVIQGNYSVTDGDGNTTDTVALVTYTSPVILGYANLTPEEAVEEVTEEVTEEVAEEVTEEVAELTEEIVETDGEELTASAEEVVETEEGETEAGETATVDYVSQVTALYTQAMSLTEGDTESAATVWDELMAIWEQIYAEEEAGTLALTTEEYDNVNTLTDEVYDYFVTTAGYDPYGVMTLEGEDETDLSKLAEVTWSFSSASYAEGEFTLNYRLNFSGLTYAEATDGDEAIELYYQLTDIIPYGVATDFEYTGYDGDTPAFNYWFKQNNDGTYYIVIKVLDSYLSTLKNTGDSGTEGYIDFWSHSVETKSDGSTYVTVNGNEEVDIEYTFISHDENETWTSDITVTKSASTYDPENNTITYTIYVSSDQGTSTINLTDLLSGLTGLTISDITVDSVQYQQDTDGNGRWDEASKSVTDVSDDTTAFDSNTTGATYYYTTYPSAGATSNLAITLSPLGGVVGSYSYSAGDRYVITYTVTFEPTTSELNSTVYNNATAKSYDESIKDYITDTAKTTTYVQTTIVDKSGTYADGKITWTIDFNPYGADVSGYTLTDAKFAAADTIEITYGDNNTPAKEGVDYTYDNGVITFIANTDTDDDGDPDVNKYNYTITYTETVEAASLGSAVAETNTVIVDDGSGNEISKTETVSVPPSESGDVSKTYDFKYEDTTTGVISMYWTTTLTVSKNSIVADTTIMDNLAYGLYTTTVSSAGQWFTLTDIARLYQTISSASSDGSSGLVFVDSDTNTTYVIGTSMIYVIDNTTGNKIAEYDYLAYNQANAYTTESGFFYMQVYDPSSGWIDVATVLDSTNLSTYEDSQFTAYCIVFNVSLDGTESYDGTDYLPNVSGTATFTYTSTSNSSYINKSLTYYNTVNVGNLTEIINHTEYEKVYKTDGYGRDYDSETTTTDGTLTWKVKVYADPNVNYYGSGYYTVTDTLPSGVSFVSATVTADNKSATVTETDKNVALADGYVTGAFGTDGDGNNTLTLTIPYSTFSSLTTKEGNYIEITYTCKIDDFSLMNLSDGNSVGVYENSVSVKYNDTNYGSDEQTQTVTYEDGSSSGGDDLLDKTSSYVNETNTINYEITFNLDGKTLLEGQSNGTLTLVDALHSYANASDGSYATLKSGSVKFYQLYKLDYVDAGEYSYTDSKGATQTFTTSDIDNDDNVYKDDDGNYYLKEELDIAWVYTEEESWGNVYHYITAEIPDSTPILMTYSYLATTPLQPGVLSTSYQLNITNSVTVTGESVYSDDDSARYDYNNAGTSGGITSLVIYKTDSTNTGVVLQGAGFAVYKWNGSTWDYVVTLVTDANGRVSISSSDLIPNTAYYIVEEYAPSGYLLDGSMKHYFYASSTDTAYSATYPSDWSYNYSGVVDITMASKTYYVGNTAAPTTTLTVTKHGKLTITDEQGKETVEDKGNLSGAVFTLYYYDSTNGWVATEHTYTTGKDGTLTVSATDGYYSYNVAYKLVETAAPEGYSIDDDAVVYFWWYNSSSSLADYPSSWASDFSDKSTSGDGTSEKTPINLTTGNATTQVDNEAVPTISVSVEKAWQSDDGNSNTTALTAAEAGALNYAAKAQLYYYLVKDETNTGGTTTDGVTLYFGGKDWTYATAPSTSKYTTLPVGEYVKVTVNYTASRPYLYTKAYNSSNYTYSSQADNGTKANPYIVQFEVSDDYDYYQVNGLDSVTINNIEITYTTDSGITYIITSTDGENWTPTTSGGSSTPSAGASDVDYYNLTGVTTSSDTQKLGAPYLMDGKEVIVDLTYSGDYKASIDNLPEYMYDSNGDKWYYYYYFVETYAYGSTTDSDGVITSATYSSADGVTDGGSITITNTVTKTDSVLLPSTGGAGTKLLYEFGGMLILLSLVGAGGYRNLSRLRKSLVSDPAQEKVPHSKHRKRVPGMRNRKFVTHRHPRKGDTRAGPDDG